jgi:hydroxypyruvate isomerase
MPTFAANLTMLYNDSPFLERFARARASGFRFVEYLFPYEYEPPVLARALAQNNLTQVLFNLPAGNWSAGDRGIAAHPDRISEFQQGVARALEYASVLGVRQLNCLVGKRDERVPLEEQRRVMIENLRYAARTLDERGMTLLVEHLNPYDVPGFLLVTPQAAFDIQTQVGAPNLKIQYDVYHAQRTAGELANTLQKHIAHIGHIQIADNPGRHQPGTGEINYRFLFEWIDKVGYRGYIGLEYAPQGSTEESLRWVREYGYAL